MLDRTPEQQEIVEAVRRFVEKDVIPHASRYEHEDAYPTPMVETMKQLGLFGATVPEEYGGLALDTTTYAMIVEELAYGWMSLSGVLNTHMMLANTLRNFGTDEQRKRYLPAMARGEHRAALCLTEPHAGSDVQRIRTTAVKKGDQYVVNGTKMFITNAETATLFSLATKTDPDAEPPYKGISLFVAEKGPGVTVGRKLDKLGYKGIETCEVVFEDFHVPAASLIGGEEGQGFKQVLSGLETGRINIAARAVGVARAALDASIRYSQQRTTFGKPICEHQAIQLKLADMATKIDAAALLTYRAAWMKDQGLTTTKESAMAKLFASEIGVEVADKALQIFGGYGYIKDFPAEKYYRDMKLCTIGEGTSEIQRVVIAREILSELR